MKLYLHDMPHDCESQLARFSSPTNDIENGVNQMIVEHLVLQSQDTS